MLYLFSFCRKIFVRHLSSFFFSSSSHDW
jgi:hypothetical protein